MTRARDVATQGGLVLLNTTNISSVSSVAIDNVFSSAYDNYLVDIVPTAITSGGGIGLAGRVSQVDKSASFSYQRFYSQATNNVGSQVSNSSTIGYLDPTNATLNAYRLTLFAPNRARVTTWFSDTLVVDNSGNFYLDTYRGFQNTTDQWDGFKLTFGGNATARIKVYGYK